MLLKKNYQLFIIRQILLIKILFLNILKEMKIINLLIIIY